MRAKKRNSKDHDPRPGADVLRRLASGVESGSIELGRDEGPVTVPEEFEVEIEYEEETDEAELEVELEWSGGDDGASSTEEDESDETEETEPTETDDEEKLLGHPKNDAHSLIRVTRKPGSN